VPQRATGAGHQAAELADALLVEMGNLRPWSRPYVTLTEVQFLLGRDNATALAVAGYKQAWCDGPPYCRARDLRDAERLLALLGVEPPVLPVTDPATITVPFEDEIRRYIDKKRRDRAAER
jgi:hypothetical protein